MTPRSFLFQGFVRFACIGVTWQSLDVSEEQQLLPYLGMLRDARL